MADGLLTLDYEPSMEYHVREKLDQWGKLYGPFIDFTSGIHRYIIRENPREKVILDSDNHQVIFPISFENSYQELIKGESI